jgi:hypothetical protein
MEKNNMYDKELEAAEIDLETLDREARELDDEFEKTQAQIDQINHEIEENDKLMDEKNDQLGHFEKLRDDALKIEKIVTEKYSESLEEEQKIIENMIKTETYVSLLKETVHSFSIFRDYFTSEENPTFDPSIKISKFQEISISPEESKSKPELLTFKSDTIIHSNSFKFHLSPTEYISQRLSFLYDFLLSTRAFPKNGHLKVVIVVGNKSMQLFEAIMQGIYTKMRGLPTAELSVNLGWHSGNKKISKLKWKNGEVYGLEEAGQDILREKVATFLEEFYAQKESQLLE